LKDKAKEKEYKENTASEEEAGGRKNGKRREWGR
jgi:hypothetical protein